MRQIRNLNKKWAFCKDVKEPPQSFPLDWYLVNLPHTWNGIDGQDGGGDYFRGKACYAKKIEKNALPGADRYYLEINGANASADVYWNGEKLCHHEGGYSTFRTQITESLLKSENLLVIMVDNGVNEEVYPQKADFTFYGGLYRDVNLIAVSASHFDLDTLGGPGMRVTPTILGAGSGSCREGGNKKCNNANDALVEMEVYVTDPIEGQQLLYEIRDEEGTLIAKMVTDVGTTTVTLSIPGAHLWNGRKDPYLYTAKACLLSSDKEELDAVHTRFGCRTFYIDPQKGFFLNGESYPLRGVSRHQDRPEIGNALLPAHHEEDMDLICELGANTIRLAHYQHDQYFYDLCDEKGMVVWAEIPYISHHMERGRKNTISQLKELITQNYNHPCIVVWSISNEITITGRSDDLLDNHRVLNDLAHEMDKTRLTTLAVVSECSIDDPYVHVTDVVSYNHYFGWYGGEPSMTATWLDNFNKTYPNRAIGVSEYGCEALNWHTSTPIQADYTEEYQAWYHEEMIKILFTRPYLWATHVWNMFDFAADARDEGGEAGMNHKGLVTFDRKYKKDAFYAYKAWLSDEPFVHVCGARYIDRAEDVTKVTVYSNQPLVELFVNEKSVGKKKSGEHFFYFEVPNMGESRICARAGECQDEIRIRKVDKPNEDYILKDKNILLNWFDVTQKEGYFSLNSMVKDVNATKEGYQIVREMFIPKLPDEATMDYLQEMLIAEYGLFTMLRMSGSTGLFASFAPDSDQADSGLLTKEELLSFNDRLNTIPIFEGDA